MVLPSAYNVVKLSHPYIAKAKNTATSESKRALLL